MDAPINRMSSSKGRKAPGARRQDTSKRHLSVGLSISSHCCVGPSNTTRAGKERFSHTKAAAAMSNKRTTATLPRLHHRPPSRRRRAARRPPRRPPPQAQRRTARWSGWPSQPHQRAEQELSHTGQASGRIEAECSREATGHGTASEGGVFRDG